MKLKEFYTDESKWCKHSYQTSKGAKCLFFALCEFNKTHQPIIDYISKHYLHHSDIISFNDDPLTKFEDIKTLINTLDI